jgi:hypothetical protein
MQIVGNENNRILIKDNNESIDISNGVIVKYVAILYKKISADIFSDKNEIKTKFIGRIERHRSKYYEGITGIYIVPLYVQHNNEWCKIMNYTRPSHKYFFYPHLLMCPNSYYHFKPLYYLHTIEPVYIDDVSNCEKEYYLEYSSYSEPEYNTI